MLPLNQIISQFNEKGVETGDILTLFGKRAGPAMLALLAEGSGALQDYTRDLENAGDTAARMADIQQEGIVGVMTNMSSDVRGKLVRSASLEFVIDKIRG